MQGSEVLVKPSLQIVEDGARRWNTTIGQPIVLQKWESGMALHKQSHTQVPVWIKLHHLPVELWTDDGLSTVASAVGKPLYQDSIMKTCARLDYARGSVMLD
ncbi:UNVERIFIED_CONTAM: hypothetical protein Slati_1146900 [Sesamum latifolium]|uniref:DUF4283 domain-containing protein n=1 Tax=Sesamum latifolium TaxID=2727402 RepID=A0AAW2XD03_9LAMI